MSIARFFITYIKERLGWLLLFITCCSIFAVVFALYKIPLGAIIYPAALCLMMCLIAFFWDCAGKYRAHKRLTALRTLPENLAQELTAVGGQQSRDYRELIRLLCEREAQLQTQASEKYYDMIEYYTTWAHQIKTPIASMSLMLQGEDSAFSRRLREELFSINAYVEMVLTYLRLDSDSTDYVFREHSLDEIIRRSLRKFAGQFISRGIKLNYTHSSQQKIITDDKWLSFVIEQILSNSLKYTPSGSITIEITEPAALCIRDTGIGIAPEDLPRIFEKGYTGRNGRNESKSSGLGLYLCRRICTNLGIPISAQASPGGGTAITLLLDKPKTVFD